MPSNSNTHEEARPLTLSQIREIRNAVVSFEPKRALKVIEPSGRAIAMKGLVTKTAPKITAKSVAITPTGVPPREVKPAMAKTVAAVTNMGAAIIVAMAKKYCGGPAV